MSDAAFTGEKNMTLDQQSIFCLNEFYAGAIDGIIDIKFCASTNNPVLSVPASTDQLHAALSILGNDIETSSKIMFPDGMLDATRHEDSKPSTAGQPCPDNVSRMIRHQSGSRS